MGKHKRPLFRISRHRGIRLGVAVVPYLLFPDPLKRRDEHGVWILQASPTGRKGWHILAYFGPWIATLEIMHKRIQEDAF